MRFQVVHACAAIALALPLGACSNPFLGIHFARHAPKVETRVAQAPVTAAETELGRKQLGEGQVGLAVATFQRALAAGEPMAPAVNGLGVAFAQLGRDDLAERYFQQAMAADPGNQRYADNLTRLMRMPSFAARSAAAISAQAEKEGAALLAQHADAQGAGPQAFRPQPIAPGRIERLSRSEVRITTSAPQAAPLRSAAKQLDGRFKPVIRIVLAPEQPEGFKPLVRIPLPQAKPLEAKAGSNR